VRGNLVRIIGAGNVTDAPDVLTAYAGEQALPVQLKSLLGNAIVEVPLSTLL